MVRNVLDAATWNAGEQRVAQRFADYLLTKGIAVSVDDDPDHNGSRIWVRNEDHLEPARREFAQFTAAPNAPVYQEAERHAEQLRADERRRIERGKESFVDMGTRWRGGAARRFPVTVLLVAVCVAIAVYSNLGSKDSVITELTIVPYEVQGRFIHYMPLKRVWYQEPWRIVTPILIHFGVMHILFDMLMLLQLGMITEACGARGGSPCWCC